MMMTKTQIPESPIPHLLSTNDAPTKEEIVFAQEAIEKAQLLLEQVSTADANSRKRLASFIRRHQAVLSPIRRRKLPQEIWLSIFSLVGSIYDLERATEGALVPAAVLSRVCRSWRACALESPQLWATLPIIGPPSASIWGLTRTMRQRFGILEYLLRSENAPLRFKLTIILPIADDVDTTPLGVIVQQAKRWREVVISTMNTSFLFLNSIKGRLPLLERLSIDIQSKTRDPVNIDMFGDAPRLQHVCLKGSLDNVSVSLPTDQLVSFKTSSATLCLQVLSAIPPLLESLDVIWADAQLMRSITLPSLTSLKVQFQSGPTDFLACLPVPRIRVIDIDFKKGCWDQQVIAALGTQLILSPPTAFSTLTTLRLHGCEQLLEGVVALLSLTKAVEDLDIFILSSKDIRKMVYINEDATLLPRLKSCTFVVSKNIRDQDFPVEALNLFASSRCDQPRTSEGTGSVQEVARLEQLCIQFATRKQARRQWTALEGWKESEGSQSSTLWELRWQSLHQELPLDTASIDADKEYNATPLKKILDDLEQLTITDGSDILVSFLYPYECDRADY
ncbi:hypothetical protein NLJ89_g9132 [Agrocybe chaxingu]|uniref:F-box domain-containing protein n=1 Tax=Agrocybe chaxingu TaxID=84603 RepID=A0A9W8MS45_9AGAR|nr:hypothetical protein NLJ89_g9132 [Agrocybe chaxingu]